MKILHGKEKQSALNFLDMAAEASSKAVCLKRPRGAVLVQNGKVISLGANAPADKHVCQTCLRDQMKPRKFATFNTEPCYSIHAEQRAIINAYKSGVSDLTGAKMYFTRMVDGEHSPVTSFSCSICSKLILETGIKSFICLNKEGVCEFSAQEMNQNTFDYLENIAAS